MTTPTAPTLQQRLQALETLLVGQHRANPRYGKVQARKELYDMLTDGGWTQRPAWA